MLSLAGMRVSECFKQTKSNIEYYNVYSQIGTSKDKTQTFGADMYIDRI